MWCAFEAALDGGQRRPDHAVPTEGYLTRVPAGSGLAGEAGRAERVEMQSRLCGMVR
jgi:hypothetical protein